VLDVSVPEAWASSPTRLRDSLARLPRLRHLHVSLSAGACQLAPLAALARLKTLAIDYSGPPALRPCGRARLEAALPATKVQIWEQTRVRGCPGPGGDAGRGDEGGAHGLWRAVRRSAARGFLAALVVFGGAAVAVGVLQRRAAARAGCGAGGAGRAAARPSGGAR
jgi:hypothetical protein